MKKSQKVWLLAHTLTVITSLKQSSQSAAEAQWWGWGSEMRQTWDVSYQQQQPSETNLFKPRLSCFTTIKTRNRWGLWHKCTVKLFIQTLEVYLKFRKPEKFLSKQAAEDEETNISLTTLNDFQGLCCSFAFLSPFCYRSLCLVSDLHADGFMRGAKELHILPSVCLLQGPTLTCTPQGNSQLTTMHVFWLWGGSWSVWRKPTSFTMRTCKLHTGGTQLGLEPAVRREC